MYRLVALLLSPLAMAGLFYAFGFIAVLVCFALLLASVVFSSGPEEQHSQRCAPTQGFGELSTFMGGL